MSDRIPTPSARARAAYQAIQGRLASHVDPTEVPTRAGPASRVVCCWCSAVMVEGDRDGITSHGICKHYECQALASEPITASHVEELFSASEVAWGRYMRGAPVDDEAPADERRAVWEQAEHRARTAIRKLAEDYERRIAQLMDGSR